MFAEVDARITAENLADYEYTDRLGDYLQAMPGSLNRCLSNIVSRRILPVKSQEIKLSEGERRHSTYRFDLSKIADLYDVARIVSEADNGYDGDYPFRMEGKILVLLAPDEHASFTLLYYPTIPEVRYNSDEVELPDEIAQIIPYFIKGELFREDEVGDAAEAMSWYEQRIADLEGMRTEKQSKVSSVYAQVML